MRRVLALAALLGIFDAGSASALEKKSVAITDDGAASWMSGFTCYVTYYNVCTGWVWVWSGWGSGDTVGACVQGCTPASVLEVSWLYIRTASPSGYGFTGTIDVRAADASSCPTGPALDSQVFLPVNGWNSYLWWQGFVNRCVVSFTTGPGNQSSNPLAIDTDHPAIGPTGPQACGFCYPVNRPTHSFYYGTASAPLCPGSPLNDGVCDAELRWEFGLSWGIISVEQYGWGKIKTLYR